MGIFWLPPDNYKCSKCGAEHCDKTTIEREGRKRIVISCVHCGHKIEYVEKSLWDKEMSSTVIYETKPSDPIPF